MWEGAPALGDNTFAAELLPCCLSVALGKVKQLDCLYMVRQVNHPRHRLPDHYDWITNPEWQSSYLTFKHRLSEEVARQDGIDIESAEDTVKRGFWRYLSQGMNIQWNRRYALPKTGIRSTSTDTAKRIPGLRGAWHTARSFFPGASPRMSLPALLRRGSPYHGAFMPVFRAMSNQPSDAIGEDQSKEQTTSQMAGSQPRGESPS